LNKKNKNSENVIEKVVKNEIYTSKSDPEGSYTGVPVSPSQKPVQDADDL
jgi:hypothetical protein